MLANAAGVDRATPRRLAPSRTEMPLMDSSFSIGNPRVERGSHGKTAFTFEVTRSPPRSMPRTTITAHAVGDFCLLFRIRFEDQALDAPSPISPKAEGGRAALLAVGSARPTARVRIVAAAARRSVTLNV